jgi:flagellar hook-length control protein FliK
MAAVAGVAPGQSAQGENIVRPRTASEAGVQAGIAKPQNDPAAGTPGARPIMRDPILPKPADPPSIARKAGDASEPARTAFVVPADAHAAPVSPAPAQQIAASVIDALPRAGTAPPPLDSHAPSVAAAPAVTAPPKTLQIQLAPADLGGVTVKLRLSGGTLELSVEAEHGETARLLDRDRDRLAKALHTAGYQLDKVTIRTADPGSAPQGAGDQRGQSQGQDQSGPRSGPQAQSGGSTGSDAQPRARPETGRDEQMLGSERGEHDESADTRRSSGDLYI